MGKRESKGETVKGTGSWGAQRRSGRLLCATPEARLSELDQCQEEPMSHTSIVTLRHMQLSEPGRLERLLSAFVAEGSSGQAGAGVGLCVPVSVADRLGESATIPPELLGCRHVQTQAPGQCLLGRALRAAPTPFPTQRTPPAPPPPPCLCREGRLGMTQLLTLLLPSDRISLVSTCRRGPTLPRRLRNAMILGVSRRDSMENLRNGVYAYPRTRVGRSPEPAIPVVPVPDPAHEKRSASTSGA